MPIINFTGPAGTTGTYPLWDGALGSEDVPGVSVVFEFRGQYGPAAYEWSYGDGPNDGILTGPDTYTLIIKGWDGEQATPFEFGGLQWGDFNISAGVSLHLEAFRAGESVYEHDFAVTPWQMQTLSAQDLPSDLGAVDQVQISRTDGRPMQLKFDDVVISAPAARVVDVTAPEAQRYHEGDSLDFVVKFDQAVDVNTAGGDPFLKITLGSQQALAKLVEQDGDTLIFRYTLVHGDQDFDGIGAPSVITVPLGSGVTGTGGVAATLTGLDFGDLSGVTVGGDPPVVGGLTGTVAWYEGGDAVKVADGATITDSDSTHLSSATVKITSGFVAAQDKLTFEGSDATGDIQGLYNSATGVMKLSSSGATLAQFEAAVHAVSYENTSDGPTGATRVISVSATDDDRLTSLQPASRVLEITGVNDAPSGVDKLITIAEDTPRTLSAADFPFTDAEGDSLATVTIVTTPGAGSLTYNGSAVDSGAVISVADINAGKLIYRPAADANGTGYASFTFQVQDDGGTDRDGVDTDASPNTITFDVTPVNDRPSLGGASGVVTFREGLNGAVAEPVAVAPDITVTDVDGRVTAAAVTLTVNFRAGQDVLNFTNGPGMGDIQGSYVPSTGLLSLSSAGGATPAEFQAALRAITYVNTSESPDSSPRTVTFRVADGEANSGPVTQTVRVEETDDTPSGTDDTIIIDEDTAHVFSADDFGFSDVDGGTLSGVTITTLPTGGAITLDGGDVTAGQIVTRDDIDAGKLVYQPPLDANGADIGSFTFQVMDDLGEDVAGQPVDQSPNTITFAATPQDDAPVIGPLVGSVTFQEPLNGAPATPVAVAPDIVVSDIDSPLLRLSTVTITNYHRGEDVLSFTPGPGMGNISFGFNSRSGVLGLNTAGATAEEVQTALRAVTYSNTSESPSTEPRVLEFVISDINNYSEPVTRTLFVEETDDTPSGADQAFSTLEDDDHVFGADDFGFSDIDGGTLRGVTITTLPEAGAITLDGTAVTAGQVVSRADIDAGKLVFRGPLNVAGDDVASFTFQVMDDLGDDYNGQAVDQSPNTITFSLTPVSDSPTGTSATLSVGQDASRALTVADFGFVDVDGDELVSVKIAATPQHGALTLNGVAVSVGQVIGVADIAAGKLVFVPAPGEYGAAYADVAFQLKDDGDTTNGGQTLDANPDTLTFNVTEAPPEPPKPPATTPTVDGVPVTTTTGTSPSGTPTQTVTIPVVTTGRTESVGGNTVADIPLVTGSGATLLSAQVPVGYGLTISGPSAPQTAGTSLTDLIREIQAHTASGSSDQTSLTGGGSGFLGGLTASTPLLVQTVVPTGGGAGAAPLVINGTASAPGDPLTALVIDTRGLPLGSTLQLNNVEFAAVIGSVAVTGGAGSQTVYGDGASQYLFLGADDDELHGGGGTDTVASAGGADRLYGDDGSDSVSGGIGDDIVHGNAGSDTVSGGEGNDIAYGGKDADRVTGEAGNDLIFGDLGDDVLQGNTGQDSLDGGMGADTVHGGQDNDQVTGGDGNDAVLGDAGDDVIQGGLGADTATGGIGGDLIHGGQGDDVIYGEAGNDWLSGDKGSDTLSGGAGADTFHANAQTGLDWVTDFNFAEGDRVLLDLGTTYAVSQGTSGVVIDIAGGAQMVLAGVQLASLGDGWIGLG